MFVEAAERMLNRMFFFTSRAHLSCLLDLPAAFDTIDHNILITRFSSWFGIHGSVLNWFKSYLTSRSFRVKCDKDFSSEHISPCGALKVVFSVHYFWSCRPPDSDITLTLCVLRRLLTHSYIGYL